MHDIPLTEPIDFQGHFAAAQDDRGCAYQSCIDFHVHSLTLSVSLSVSRRHPFFQIWPSSGTLLLLSAGTASLPSYRLLYLLFLHRVSALSGQNTSLAAKFSASPLHYTSFPSSCYLSALNPSALGACQWRNGAMLRSRNLVPRNLMRVCLHTAVLTRRATTCQLVLGKLVSLRGA